MDFTAHIRESDGMEQSVTEHCRNVAALAEMSLLLCKLS